MELDYGEPTSAFSMGDVELNPRLAPGEIFDVAMEGDEDGDLAPAERAQARRESEALRRGAKFYKLPQEEGAEVKSDRDQEEELEETEEAATPPEVPTPIGGGLDVRLVALNLTGDPIKQLSTSRLFAYVTHCGAAPLGLEWINDSSCNVVFADSESTLAGLAAISRTTGSNLSLLALPDVQDLAAAAAVQLAHERGEPTEEPIPEILTAQLLQPRRAHAVPLKLYTTVEKEAIAAAQHIPAAVAAVPDDAPAIYAEMAAEEALEAAKDPSVVALRQLQGALWARFALESVDNKKARASGFSQWYAAHGTEAGREVVPKLLNIQPKQARGRGNQGQSQLDLLDAELEEMRNQPSDDEDNFGAPHHAPPEGEARADRVGKWKHDEYKREAKRERNAERNMRPGRGAYRGGATMDALDEELESHASERQRDRSSSPGRRMGPSSGHSTPGSNTRIRGRGAMRAPGASRGWEDVDEADVKPFRPFGGKGAGMMADAQERQQRQPRGRRDQGERWQRNGESGTANTSNARLADRFSGGSLLDRMG